MEASELRQSSVDELKGRIRQWQDELFRARFKGQSSEAKDTSVIKKLRRDIARANTVLVEKNKGIALPASASVPKQKALKPKKETKAAPAEDRVETKADPKKKAASKKVKNG